MTPRHIRPTLDITGASSTHCVDCQYSDPDIFYCHVYKCRTNNDERLDVCKIDATGRSRVNTAGMKGDGE